MMQQNGMFGIPVFFRGLINEDNNAKLHEDRYELYVNGEYAGDRTLVAEKEDAEDIADFLELQGFHNIHVDVEGDHLMIHCSNEHDARHIENAVKVFLENR